MKKRANKKILEKNAASLRKEFGFSNTEPIHLKSLLLKQGILALFRPMSNNFSGMALKIEEEGEIHRFMMVNSGMSVGHQHFTICHELYHLYIQSGFESQICNVGTFDKKDIEEYNADVFASFFLLPKEAIYHNVSDTEIENSHVTLATVLKLENMFSCSRKALLIRLKELELISDDSFQSYQQSIKQLARSYGYSPYLYEPSPAESVVGNYGELAHILYDSEIISESHYYNLMSALGVSIEDIEFQVDE